MGDDRTQDGEVLAHRAGSGLCGGGAEGELEGTSGGAAEGREAWNDHGFIFAAENGEPLNTRNLDQRHFQKIRKAAELPRLRLYDLRHSHATLLLANGEHPKVVSERLGHASVTLTLDTYSHVLAGMQEQATARLDALLSEARSA